MPDAKEVYVNCDVLEKLPRLNRENWLYEIDLLCKELPRSSTVLQVGSMDGSRIFALLDKRPDLVLTGIEIESSLIEIARKSASQLGYRADFILGDISNPADLPRFDYVICLNNTLGYISNEKQALEQMKRLGRKVILSVYGEKFDDHHANTYFKSIGLILEQIKGNLFQIKDFTRVKRYTKQEVDSWNSEVMHTPLGYFCILDGLDA